MNRQPVMPKRFLAAAMLAVFLAGGATDVHAADISPAQAQDLAKQLRGFAASTVGPDAKVPEDLIRVAPEGDQYRVSLAITGLSMPDKTAALTATARQRSDGTWTVNDIRLPQTTRFSFDVPAETAGEREKAKAKLHLTGTLTIAGQDSHAVYDPSFATPSTLASGFHAMEMHATGPGIEQTMKLDHHDGLITLRPAGNDRFDILEDVSAEGYSSSESRTGGPSFAFSAKKLSLKAEIDGLALNQMPGVIQASISLGKHVAAERHPEPAFSAIDQAALHRLVQALTGIMSGMRMTETLEGVRLEFDGHEITADRLTYDMNGAAPETMLTTKVGIVLDGLNIAGLPPDIAAYVPHHIEMRPALSHVDAKALTEIALSATEPDADRTMIEAKLLRLLQQGGIDLGLERFAIDIGPAKLAGAGTVNVSGPLEITGKADLIATGFDQLMDQVKDTPDAATAMPILALMRGFAKTDGEQLVWHVSMDHDRKILVNGIDISKLTGGGGH